MLINLKDVKEEIRSTCLVFHNADPVFISGDSYFKIGTMGGKLEDGKAYVIGEYVYPYWGQTTVDTDLDKLPVGIYKHDREYYFRPVSSNQEKELCSIENITATSLPAIWKEVETNTENFISDEDREMINNNVKEYRPTIKVADDPLKKLVKQAIIDKGVNVNLFKGVFDEKHGLTNIKSTLNNKSNLTMMKFLQWCEMLNLNYKITVYDNGEDNYYPLLHELNYDSGKGIDVFSEMSPLEDDSTGYYHDEDEE